MVKSMTAKEMFQQIGYKQTTCSPGLICYYGKDVDGAILWICFDIEGHTFNIDRNDRPKDVTVGEFKAIHKQMEELRWL